MKFLILLASASSIFGQSDVSTIQVGNAIPNTEITASGRAQYLFGREECKNPPCRNGHASCCPVLKFGGGQKAETSGIYIYQGIHNERPFYKHVDGTQALWHFGADGRNAYWLIGPAANLENGQENYGHHFIQQDMFCPDLAINQWYEYIANTWVINDDTNIECHQKTITGSECVGDLWTDVDLESCQDYATNEYCTYTGGFGTGWGENWGEFTAFENQDQNALMCPECGCKTVESDQRCSPEADMEYWFAVNIPFNTFEEYAYVPTVEECMQICLGSTECNVFAYSLDTTMCYLKSKATASVKNYENFISGVRCSYDHGLQLSKADAEYTQTIDANEDYDECASSVHECPEFSVCKDVSDGYICEPESGFECKGVNCLDMPNVDSKVCKVAQSGKFHDCEIHDIDECFLEKHHECPRHSSCRNMPGRYRCKANGGYSCVNATDVCEGRYCAGIACDFPDIDECARDTNVCPDISTCLNLEKGYACMPDPYHQCQGEDCQDFDGKIGCRVPFNAEEGHCSFSTTLVNECASASSNKCPENSECVDMDEDYVCKASDGFVCVGNSCVDVQALQGQLACKPNENGDIDCNFSDIDECLTNNHRCPQLSTCVNADGRYNCAPFEGYECVTSMDVCVNNVCEGTGCGFRDIDECSSDVSQCPEFTSCINSAPGFQCRADAGFACSETENEACKVTYCDGNSCQFNDINECAQGQECPLNSECLNVAGSFNCAPVGNVECIALNDLCLNNTCVGSMCTFNDIDECSTGISECPTNSVCENAQGHFHCKPDAGFVCMSNDGSCLDNVCNGNSCMFADDDECESDSHQCPANSECENVPGGYKCAPSLGFNCVAQNDLCLNNTCLGYQCGFEDIDECDIYTCPYDSSCVNVDGGIACIPDVGFTCQDGCVKVSDDVNGCFVPAEIINANRINCEFIIKGTTKTLNDTRSITYVRKDARQSLADAEAWCVDKLKGFLPVPQNDEENGFLAGLGATWLDPSIEPTHNLTLHYSNWAEGEPSNGTGKWMMQADGQWVGVLDDTASVTCYLEVTPKKGRSDKALIKDEGERSTLEDLSIALLVLVIMPIVAQSIMEALRQPQLATETDGEKNDKSNEEANAVAIDDAYQGVRSFTWVNAGLALIVGGLSIAASQLNRQEDKPIMQAAICFAIISAIAEITLFIWRLILSSAKVNKDAHWKHFVIFVVVCVWTIIALIINLSIACHYWKYAFPPLSGNNLANNLHGDGSAEGSS